MLSNSNKAPEGRLTDEFITSIQKKMLAFAKSQLNDVELAEDAVQEAMLAAFNHKNKFRGEAMFKTWVFAILKNKITDEIRKKSRYVSVSEINSDHKASSNEDDILEILFDERGFWKKDSKPQAFNENNNNPESEVYSEDFWKVMDMCLSNLPAKQSRAFLMREYIELATEEICQEMEISQKNYYILMHRARLQLQTCLNARWFQES